MAFSLFGKKKIEKNKDTAPVQAPASDQTESNIRPVTGVSHGAYLFLESPHVSEKASSLQAMGQYVFRVRPSATAPEVRKAIAQRYNVHVKTVRMLTMPKKRKDIGRHPGYRSGFRKAIVVLEKGESIPSLSA